MPEPTYLPCLDADRVTEALGHTHALWSGGRAMADYVAFTRAQLDFAGPDLLRYVGLADASGLVASAKRYGVAIAGPGGRVAPAVGVGAVFTREDARGRGHASALVRRMVDDARAEGAAAAWLHAEIDPAMYTRLGFRALPAGTARATVADLPAGAPLALRPAAPEDLDRLLAWYDAGFADGPWLRPARSAASFRYFALRNAVRVWIASDLGRDVGYLCARPAEQRLWVEEWSAPGVDPARVLATLRAMAEREALPAVAGWLRPDHAAPPFQPGPPRASVPMIALLASPWTDDAVPSDRSWFGAFDYF